MATCLQIGFLKIKICCLVLNIQKKKHILQSRLHLDQREQRLYQYTLQKCCLFIFFLSKTGYACLISKKSTGLEVDMFRLVGKRRRRECDTALVCSIRALSSWLYPCNKAGY